MESMTGYAFVERCNDQFSYSMELKSLNSKYLETYLNLPRILRNEENDFDAVLKKSFGRGKIELSIEIHDMVAPRPVSINREVLKRYYGELVKTTRELRIGNHFSIDALLQLDGVIQKGRTAISAKSRAEMFRTLATVIKRNMQMRRREGASTARDIRNSLRVIAARLGRIEALAGGVARSLYGRLKESIESLAGGPVDDVRLYAEIAILAEKQDINEEIMRLRDHMNKARLMMRESGQIGKRLDFLAQEMFREINTIASKSNSSEISHLAVDIKNQIDKIREQCRNIV